MLTTAESNIFFLKVFSKSYRPKKQAFSPFLPNDRRKKLGRWNPSPPKPKKLGAPKFSESDDGRFQLLAREQNFFFSPTWKGGKIIPLLVTDPKLVKKHQSWKNKKDSKIFLVCKFANTLLFTTQGDFFAQSVHIKLAKHFSPPWGTWLRTHYWWDREEKKPSILVGFDPRPLCHEECALPLCHNRCPTYSRRGGVWQSHC